VSQGHSHRLPYPQVRQPTPPSVRRESEVVHRIRETLGAGRYDRAFAEGFQLDQRQAVAVARDGRGVR
jgi:hypothetical protein